MKTALVVPGFLLFSAVTMAAETTVTMNAVDAKGVGSALGTVRVTETPYGLAFHPSLEGLSAGLHGFHVHENPSCAPAEKNGAMVAGLSAGGHMDTSGAGKHGEPWGDGHRGDLPALYVDADGKAGNPVLAPRLKLVDVLNRSLMVHAGGDNHSDDPAPLGGGGARVACGVFGN